MTDDNRADGPREPVEDLTDLKFIGPATADIIREADRDAGDVRAKRVSYRMLVDAGANPGVATKIRREHSLPWSISGEGSNDLGKRSNQVRGLRDDEQAWVAASSGDWASASADSSGESEAEADGSGESEAAEAAWRERSKPTPVTDLDELTEEDARTLAKAGINSVRSLATIDAENIADLMGLDAETVEGWREAADEQL